MRAFGWSKDHTTKYVDIRFEFDEVLTFEDIIAVEADRFSAVFGDRAPEPITVWSPPISKESLVLPAKQAE